MFTVGQLIEKLKEYDYDSYVYFDFCGCTPTEVESYRGFYNRPALGWRPTGYSSIQYNRATKVCELLDELEYAIKDDVIFTAWKGGEYQYNENSILYVDNFGDENSIVISNVRDVRNKVIIETRVLYDQLH